MATYAAKGEQSPDARDALTAAKLSCAAGLAALDAKKYRAAAKKFSEARTRAQGTCPETLMSRLGFVTWVCNAGSRRSVCIATVSGKLASWGTRSLVALKDLNMNGIGKPCTAANQLAFCCMVYVGGAGAASAPILARHAAG